jgi:Domain of unknown function (DUF6745)
VTALLRRSDAANPPARMHLQSDLDVWQKAVPVRREWLDHGLSTRPADRPLAERNLTALYARLGRAVPRFEWVESPAKALPMVQGLPTLEELYGWVRDPCPRRTPPLASDLAMLVSQLRGRLSAGIQHADPELSPVRRNKRGEPWPEMAAPEALAAGVPLGVVLHQNIRVWLHRTLGDGFQRRVRRALAAQGAVPVCWYGQQEGSWIAYYDILGRLGRARYGPREMQHLDEWAALARSCGWWWPGEQVCIVVDRPAAVRVEPVPRARLGELHLAPTGVTYRDGWRPAMG